MSKHNSRSKSPQVPPPAVPGQQRPLAMMSEQAILSTFLMHPQTFEIFGTMLDKAAFTSTFHEALFCTMLEWRANGRWWTRYQLAEYFTQIDRKEYMIGLIDLVNNHSGVDMDWQMRQEVRAVTEALAFRRLQDAGVDQARSWHPGVALADIIEPSRENLDAIQALLREEQATPIGVVVAALLATMRAGGVVRRLLSGIPSFDRNTGGFEDGALYVIGARPSTGKTALGVEVSLEAARQGGEVLFVTTETTKEQMTFRALANVGQLDAFELRTNRVHPEVVSRAAAVMPAGIEYMDQTIGLTALIAAVRQWRQARAEKKVLVVVDYLELIQPPRAESREQEVSKCIVGLQQLAKDASCPVLVLSQLRRPPDTGKAKAPTMRELRFSGMIEQAADVIGLLYRGDEKAQPPQDQTIPIPIKMRVDKNRKGGVEYTADLLLWRAYSHVREATANEDGTSRHGSGGIY